MRLHTDTVDQSLCLQIRCHFADGVGLTVNVLVVVVIVQLAALGCILSCELECILNEGVVSEHLYPCGVAVGGVVGACGTGLSAVGPSLIDHVPSVEIHSGILLSQGFHHVLDVVFHTLDHDFLGYPVSVIAEILLEEPVRSLAVPYQGMPSDGNVVVPAVVEQRLCVGQRDLGIGLIPAICLHIGKGSRLVQDEIRLQLVAEGDAFIKVPFHQSHEGLGCQVGGSDSSTDLEVGPVYVCQGSDIL